MKKFYLFILIFVFSNFFACLVNAQSSGAIAFSITPPLIKNSMSPGEIWKSSIKIINNNPEEISIYAQALDFKGGKESGEVEFSQAKEKNIDGSSPFFSQWIVLDSEEIKIAPFGSKEIPFIIDVPEDASPGGHYAAILAGTAPPFDDISGSSIKISSLLASLILLNVKGDVLERGIIREFSSDKKFYQDEKINFIVRFENLGNIHLQPRGDIKIYNQFDELKDKILINHDTDFGNVLPKSIRKWNFEWESGKSLLDMGRYRAELILTYGQNEKRTIDQTIYFWVVFIKPLVIFLSAILFIIFLTMIVIRSYIRRAIRNTQRIALDTQHTTHNTQHVNSKLVRPEKTVVGAQQKKVRKKRITPKNIQDKNDVIDLKKS
ncbi:hypothetical protein KAU09_01120 [Candidatus Parcubacteria bacterium]|nr:hypothetical protein [Candidatus Parcubacteria bacterium]